jgi:catechol-2,3-dioxygenase
MPSPKVLSHIVFRTSRMDEMQEWYLSATHSRVCFKNSWASFISFDEEHHRLGFIAVPNLEEQTETQPGLQHVALRYATLGDLLETYVELRDRKIVPARCTNHGPTTSFYYKDPDQNNVEFLYNNIPDEEHVNRFMQSEVFRKNPMGLPLDPEILLRHYQQGTLLEKLTAYEPLA